MAKTKSKPSPKTKSKTKRKAANSTNGPQVWEQWVKMLRKRKKGRPFAELSESSPLLWALPHDTTSASIELIQQVGRFITSQQGDAEITDSLEAWLSTVANRRADESFAIECLAWTHCLPSLAEILPAGPWTALYDTLVQVAEERQISGNVTAVADQMLWGELPLTLEFLIPSCHELRKPGRKVVADTLDELTDRDGTPNAEHLPVARTLLAIWTRVGWLGKLKNDFALSKDARQRFSLYVQANLRLARNNGDHVFHQRGSYATSWDEELFRAALMLIDDAETDAAAVLQFPKLATEAYPQRSLRYVDEIDLSNNSEWAELTVMRNGWARKSQQYVQVSSNGIVGELNSGFNTVFSGNLTPSITLDGQLLDAPRHWMELCWHSDDDIDYIEMEGHFGGHCRVQRQAMLVREDGFFLMADAVLLDAESEIEYEVKIPLGDSVTFEANKDAREGWLASKRKLALVLPLMFPEWRSLPVDGELVQEDDKLVYRKKQVESGGLYAPLFFDLNSKRFKKDYTWRRLTIAENLEIVRSDMAAAFRIQVANDQFLVYRSLKPGANRTFMGQNLNSEFLLCRFDQDGDTEELIEIS